MYTQCPECALAFKVTATVLKQAAGQVRCGGCSQVFNALAYLSEDKPEQPENHDAGAAVPELKPESEKSGDSPIRSISAQRSAALMKTLDELAGEDIRIEDTGVEWRVLDEFEAARPAAGDDDAFLDTSAADEAADDEAVADAAKRAIEELRFDDNTPLPEDFEDDEISATPPDDKKPVDDDPDPVVEEPPVEVTLSEPDEWQDILGEFQELVEEVAAQPVPEDLSEPQDSPQPEEDSATGDQAEVVELATVEETEETAEASRIEVGEIDEDEIDSAIVDALQDMTDAIAYEAPDAEVEQLELIDESAEPDEFSDPHADDKEEHHVAPLSEDEQSLEMMIDQDLLALAVEDEDGLKSTMALHIDNVSDDDREAPGDAADDEAKEAAPGFETIIMEGEHIRTATDHNKMTADMAEAAAMVQQAKTEEAELAESAARKRWSMIAAAVSLVLVLAVQLVHQYREVLATFPAFNATVGQVYRALGQPVQPAWDITGWRFEATNGSTEGDSEDLTVFSRLGNKSTGPLPFPLISISLTDRFEEPIGSRVLDPADYLAEDVDPRELVEPGDTFDAVITIQSASPDATGFKLNACYRLTSGQLRCAVDDFK